MIEFRTSRIPNETGLLVQVAVEPARDPGIMASDARQREVRRGSTRPRAVASTATARRARASSVSRWARPTLVQVARQHSDANRR
jgi:hypothetical protein